MRREIGDYYSVHLIGNHRQKSASSGRVVLIAVLIIVLIAVLISVYFLWISPLNVKLNKADYYILFLGQSQSLTEAENLSEQISGAGGSGYIINNGVFKVSAAIYKKQNDAETVAERLKADYPSAEVIQISIKPAKIKRIDKGETDKALKNILNYPIELIDYLLAQSISLDSLETTESALLLALLERRQKIEDFKKSLETFSKNYPANDVLQKTYAFYQKIIDKWEYAGALSAEFGVYSHRIKYFSCFLLDCYNELRLGLIA